MHKIIGSLLIALMVGLIQGISSPLYAQTATQPPDSYILTVERCVKYVESA